MGKWIDKLKKPKEEKTQIESYAITLTCYWDNGEATRHNASELELPEIERLVAFIEEESLNEEGRSLHGI
tara:strand:- start:2707 stop:2916 length:210 start_codon:yes stop_codon:yes gene_type:complete